MLKRSDLIIRPSAAAAAFEATAATAAVINGLFVGFKLKLDAKTFVSNFTAAGLHMGFKRPFEFVAVDPLKLFGSI